MSQHIVSSDLKVEGQVNLSKHELVDAILDKTTGNLTAEGQVGYDTATHRAVVNDGTSAKVMAFLDDVTRLGRPKGIIDASLGLLPTNTDADAHGGNADLDDFWRVNVAGTIAGLGALKVGDVIYANKDNPTVAADFDVVPFPVDFANAFENGVSVDGTSGKAGLGGTLLRDTTILTNGKECFIYEDGANVVGLGPANGEAYCRGSELTEIGGNVARIIANNEFQIYTPTATTAGKVLRLDNATTKAVIFDDAIKSTDVENGIEVVAGKAGLGGTLLRDTTVQGAYHVEVKNTANKSALSLKETAGLYAYNPVSNQSSLGAQATNMTAQVDAQTNLGYAGARLSATENALGIESAVVSAETNGVFLRANNGKKIHIEYDESAVQNGFLVTKNGTGEVGVLTGTFGKSAKATINLVAGVALSTTFSGLTEVHTVQVSDSAGNFITIPTKNVPGTNVVELTSSTSYTGAVLRVTGV